MPSRGETRLRPGEPDRPIRRLFLDDDPRRAEAFLAEYPDAVWVATAAECVELLAREVWDEVHLDHDLGGEEHVDVGRDDCGMAVVRWIAYQPREHLRRTRFHIHSHNGPAAYVMLLQLKSQGHLVVAHPFGAGRWRRPRPRPSPVEIARSRLRRWFARLTGRSAGG